MQWRVVGGAGHPHETLLAEGRRDQTSPFGRHSQWALTSLDLAFPLGHPEQSNRSRWRPMRAEARPRRSAIEGSQSLAVPFAWKSPRTGMGTLIPAGVGHFVDNASTESDSETAQNEPHCHRSS
jgi:hypothetical protein